jgi:hypothetical protein
MIASVLVAAIVFSTPQAAALSIYFPRGAAVVTKATVARDYAIVLTRGGTIEGQLDSTPVLLQRFPFGWQPIALINAACQIRARGVPSAVAAKLAIGVRTGTHDTECNDLTTDRGSAADVVAIRAIARGPLIPFVAVSGRYGYAEWYGGGGGQSFYVKRGKTWKYLTGGGGAMNALEVARYGVPKAAACVFGLAKSGCVGAPHF